MLIKLTWWTAGQTTWSPTYWSSTQMNLSYLSSRVQTQSHIHVSLVGEQWRHLAGLSSDQAPAQRFCISVTPFIAGNGSHSWCTVFLHVNLLCVTGLLKEHRPRPDKDLIVCSVCGHFDAIKHPPKYANVVIWLVQAPPKDLKRNKSMTCQYVPKPARGEQL